ncbi:hypothetical protein BT69DRAFT_809198 [Atractiella rhizophila]|nr:hypothetical protein BT69DRAFT_809198 [Atractiella rhizophila]
MIEKLDYLTARLTLRVLALCSSTLLAGSEGLDEEDSDIEVDCRLLEAVQVDESETPTESHPVTEIKTTRTCYSTFRALLYYLLSR